MTTLVCFHAHPDDESIGSGGTIARAAAEGHRVVLVFATRGERGEPTPGCLEEGEALWERRIAESFESAEILGAQRVEFLGYVDSGMMGEPSNDFPYSFWSVGVETAAQRLAAILREEAADVLTVYDDHGGYGHPDHIQVHRVGLRAAEIAGTRRTFQGTMNRDAIRRQVELFVTPDDGPDPAERIGDLSSFGTPETDITHAIDVSDLIEVKQRSMRAHRSQIADDSWFLTMDDETFAGAFGTEWFIETGIPRAEGAPFGASLWEQV